MKKHKKHDHSVTGLSSVDYWAYASRLRAVNPGLKMAVAGFALIFCVATGNLPACICIAVASAVVTVALGGVPLQVYLRMLRIPLAFLVISSIAIIFDFTSRPAGDYCLDVGAFYVCCSQTSLWQAAQLVIVALSAVSAMYGLSLSTPVSEMTSVLERLHVPALLIEFMNMIYRFIFIMSETYRQLQTAAQSRLGYSGVKRSVRTFGGTVGNLFIVSLLNANQYYDALQARCYQGHLAFLQQRRPVTTRQGTVCALFCVAVVGIWIGTRGLV